MFTEAYAAARVRDAARWLNEALTRANEVGLFVTLHLTDHNPPRLEVAVGQDAKDDHLAD